MPKSMPFDMSYTPLSEAGSFAEALSRASPEACPEACEVSESNASEEIRAAIDHRSGPAVENPTADDIWKRLLDDVAPSLPAIARRVSGRAIDAEDALQEAWLVLVADVAASRGGDEFGRDERPAQAVVTIRNHLIDLARQAARRVSRPLTDEVSATLISREEDPAEACERLEIRENVRAVLDEAHARISDLGHRIVILRWVEGRTFAEIAAILELPVAQIRDRHRRAIPVLRAVLIRRLGADFHGLATAPEVCGMGHLESEEVTP